LFLTPVTKRSYLLELQPQRHSLMVARCPKMMMNILVYNKADLFYTQVV
jgi:hypothetical protein